MSAEKPRSSAPGLSHGDVATTAASNSPASSSKQSSMESADNKKQHHLTADVDSGYEAMEVDESEASDGRRKRTYSSAEVTDEYLMDAVMRILHVTVMPGSEGMYLPEIARHLDHEGGFQGLDDLISQILMEVLFLLLEGNCNPFEIPTNASSKADNLSSSASRLALSS